MASLIQGAAAKATATATSTATAAAEKAQNAVITTTLKQAPGGALLASTYTAFKDIGRKIKTFYTNLSPTKKMIFFACIILVIVGIVLTIYFSTEKKTPEQQIQATAQRVNDNAATLGQVKQGLDVLGLSSTLGIEGFQDCPPQQIAKKEEITLLSVQPFSIKQAGFKGEIDANGNVTSGVFDEEDAVKNALRAGIRTFVLQIDYLETLKDASLWAGVKEPCLLYKNSAGDLISTNSGSIQKVCQALADNAFVSTLPQKDDPVLVILYIMRTPESVVSKPVEYTQFLAKIAAQLAPLSSRHLGLTDRGDFHKQALEKDILTLPLATFQRKFIVACNADTTPFRRQEVLQVSIETANNLDYWTNLRIYKSDTSQVPGITEAKGDANFVVVSSGTITDSLETTEKIKALSDSLKGKVSMILPSPDKNPDTDVVDKVLDQVGINIVPLDIFSFSTAVTNASSVPWKTNSWKLKPGLLR